jgi:hypothetical protein
MSVQGLTFVCKLSVFWHMHYGEVELDYKCLKVSQRKIFDRTECSYLS